jgi:pyrroline-5-carboxylate reductase
MKKKKNILIVGCGKMGSAHIKSFLNKDNINLYLYDKSKIKLDSYKKIKNIQLLNNLRLKTKFIKHIKSKTTHF